MSGRHIMRLHNWLLASPPAEYALNMLRELLIGALRQGPIPKHIAFVMDGNRRYAKHNRIETVEGHNLGFEALARILEVCYKAGVTHVTIYAFSIENFKRSQYEVDALMDMAKTKLQQLSQHGDILERYGAHIRVLGERDFLKPDVLEVIDGAVEMSSKYEGRCVLNVCFPYTSRLEMTTAVRETVAEFCKPISPRPAPGRDHRSPFKEERIANTIRSHHLSEHGAWDDDEKGDGNSRNGDGNSHNSDGNSHNGDGNSRNSDVDEKGDKTSRNSNVDDVDSQAPPPQYPSPETITPATITKHLYTGDNPPVDLLIRTSGVSRLSDFLLWQCHEDTEIVFLDVLWPEFDLWSFLPVLWGWQWRVRKERDQKSEAEAEAEAGAQRIRIGTLRKAMKEGGVAV
ncbi:hypothetical protein DV735_g1021, partial [Chaetothyriales sp. CBS 134920]